VNVAAWEKRKATAQRAGRKFKEPKPKQEAWAPQIAKPVPLYPRSRRGAQNAPGVQAGPSRAAETQQTLSLDSPSSSSAEDDDSRSGNSSTNDEEGTGSNESDDESDDEL